MFFYISVLSSLSLSHSCTSIMKFGKLKRVCLKDCLRVDVWDFNDEESVNDKFGKINQVGHGTLS